MRTENNLCFLKQRVFEIKSALLFNLSDDLIKIPASIITVLRIDDEGQLWFFANKPSQKLFDNEKKFPARLQFYRKGKPFYLHIAGVAQIDDQKENIHELTGLEQEAENKAMQGLVLIKVKMTKAGYYEQRPHADSHNLIRSIFQNLYINLFKPAGNYRPFELTTHAA